MAVFGKRWTKEELNILSSTDDLDELQVLLPGRTLGAIKKKRLEQLSFSSGSWTEDEILKFPTEKVVNKQILYEVAEKLPGRHKDQIWKKMKSRGYIWDSSFTEEASENNPYPDHGKKWTAEELALFPKEKEVNKEILEQVRALLPRRKPSSIWPKMSKEGYIWISDEPEVTMQQVAKGLSEEELYVLSLAHELGFRKSKAGAPSLEPQLKNVEDYRNKIARNFDLPEDFTGGELYYAIGTRITPFPWEMDMIPEVQAAYRNRDSASILEAAKVLHSKLERFING